MAKKANAKANSPFTGRWRIVSMSAWDQEFIDEEEEGYFEFDQKNNGQFHLGYGHGQIAERPFVSCPTSAPETGRWELNEATKKRMKKETDE